MAIWEERWEQDAQGFPARLMPFQLFPANRSNCSQRMICTLASL